MPPGGPALPWPGRKGDDYDAAFRQRELAGADVHGEAAFVEAMGPHTVLDAGCGTGRVAIELARRGIEVVGVDRDPAMLDPARRKAPQLDWRLEDLATLSVGDGDGGLRRFDVVVAAGNVMIFLAPGSEAAVVRRLAAHLAPGGALVAGFQLLPGRLDLATYDELAEAAGLRLAERFATWERQPYEGGDYAVSVHRAPVGVAANA